MRRPRSFMGPVVLLVLLLLLGAPGTQFAHEIPARVTALVFVRPEAHTLHVLVRVPLEAIRDVEFPLRRGTYLDVERATPMLRDAATTWLAEYLTLYENDVPLASRTIAGARLSLPSDRSFSEFGAALAHIRDTTPLSVADLPWQQAMLDVAIDYPITSPASRFAIRPALARLGVRTSTSLRFITAEGDEHAFQYDGDPGVVRLDPRWHQAALTFVRLGFTHILGGIDHLLFVLCLVIPLRRLKPLVGVVTAFTVAHSITLAASVLGFAPSALWFPPLIEFLVALSIVYMAFENIAGARVGQRWKIAFAFGLVHGFAFAFALRQTMQFAGSHVATSLLAFNVGVEAGQVVVLLATVPLLNLVFERVMRERMGTIIVSALIAHTAWHWMLDRGAALRNYTFSVPALDAGLLVAAMRAAMVLIVALLAMWLLSAAGRRMTTARLGTEAGPK
ncbi:MAG: HupE/UreJ family protein [Gemmatimonadaceae bacterium]